jgi:hypothetical protein
MGLGPCGCCGLRMISSRSLAIIGVATKQLSRQSRSAERENISIKFFVGYSMEIWQQRSTNHSGLLSRDKVDRCYTWLTENSIAPQVRRESFILELLTELTSN